jgi:hypothetical protein
LLLAGYPHVGAALMGQDLVKIENTYDTVAKEYAEAFSGEHEKKPKDQSLREWRSGAHSYSKAIRIFSFFW